MFKQTPITSIPVTQFHLSVFSKVFLSFMSFVTRGWGYFGRKADLLCENFKNKHNKNELAFPYPVVEPSSVYIYDKGPDVRKPVYNAN